MTHLRLLQKAPPLKVRAPMSLIAKCFPVDKCQGCRTFVARPDWPHTLHKRPTGLFRSTFHTTADKHSTQYYSSGRTSSQPLDMRALHFGAGNIGRGFIGKSLYEAGCDVIFADIVAHLIDELARRKEFPVRVVGGQEHTDWVKIKGAIFSNTNAVFDEIVAADFITTAVGPPILAKIAPTIARGLKQRMAKQISRPVNIVACENAIRATSQLREQVLKELTQDEIQWAADHVGFVDCTVDRIVPPARMDDPLGVTVEDFCEWVIDETQLRGGQHLPRIPGLVYTPKLNAYIERKLLTVNTGHAVCAYIGKIYGHQEIRTAIKDPRIRPIVIGAMEESGNVLIQKYGMNPEAHAAYIKKIVERYENPHIVDDVSRVGRSPIRKLAPEDRLIKPILGAVHYNLPHDNLVKGVAAALLYQDPEDPEAVKLQKIVEANGLDGALCLISNLSARDHKEVGGRIQSEVAAFRDTVMTTPV